MKSGQTSVLLTLRTLQVAEGHEVAQKSIDYHNRSIYGRPL
ncbi:MULTISPECIES: hypothetical protein [unclassified Marinobacter]|nr:MULTISPECIES: hypothetical protein [unclassified Marinobacter]